MTQQSQADIHNLFEGAERHRGYEEPAPEPTPRHGSEDEASSAPTNTPAQQQRDQFGDPQDSPWVNKAARQAHPGRIPAGDRPDEEGHHAPSFPEDRQSPDPAGDTAQTPVLSGQIVPYDSTQQQVASPSALRKLLETLGVGRKQRTAEEAAEIAEFERIIRQATWTRSVNIAVGGGAGTSPAALAVGGLAAQVRGGSCVVFEATASRGHLLDLCEGSPVRGLAELIAGAELVSSAGNLAGYTIPQTSHLAVIGSVSRRPQLTGAQMRSVRGVLDTYNQVSVAALDRVLDGPLAQEALQVADAVVIPAVTTKRSLERVRRSLDDTFHAKQRLMGKVIVAVGHSGAPEDVDTAASAIDVLRRYVADAAHVVETPMERAFIADRDLSIDDLSGPSRRAWLEVTSAAISAIDDSHTELEHLNH